MKTLTLFLLLTALLFATTAPAQMANTFTNYTVTATQSTNTATSIVITAASTRPRVWLFIRLRDACHVAFGGEASTNSPIAGAGQVFNIENPVNFQEKVGIRSTNTVSATADVWEAFQ